MAALLRRTRDFEDAVQYECAKSIGADYLVTRNIRDFTVSKDKAITPKEFLKLFGKK
jgi:predicted nucleic acid-binding protein